MLNISACCNSVITRHQGGPATPASWLRTGIYFDAVWPSTSLCQSRERLPTCTVCRQCTHCTRSHQPCCQCSQSDVHGLCQGCCTAACSGTVDRHSNKVRQCQALGGCGGGGGHDVSCEASTGFSSEASRGCSSGECICCSREASTGCSMRHPQAIAERHPQAVA